MPTGIVKWFNLQKGYGFVVPDDGGEDAFIHISAVEQSGLTSLEEGQKIEYELAEGRNGKMAAQAISISD